MYQIMISYPNFGMVKFSMTKIGVMDLSHILIAVKDTGFEVLSGKKRPKVQPEAGPTVQHGPTAPFLMQGQYMSMATLMEPQTFLGR